ncbi:MAG: hypothetical protein ACREQY_05880, partial [Candidatus Binatia bacterium]
PSLCPYQPPGSLFTDDYDPERENAVWAFCGEHCWLSREEERPCLAALAAENARQSAPAGKTRPRAA